MTSFPLFPAVKVYFCLYALLRTQLVSSNQTSAVSVTDSETAEVWLTETTTKSTSNPFTFVFMTNDIQKCSYDFHNYLQQLKVTLQ